MGCLSWYPSNWAFYFMATMMCHLCLYVVSTKTSSIKQCFYKNVQCNLMTPGLGTCGHLPRLLEGLFQEIFTFVTNTAFFLFFLQLSLLKFGRVIWILWHIFPAISSQTILLKKLKGPLFNQRIAWWERLDWSLLAYLSLYRMGGKRSYLSSWVKWYSPII